MMILLGVMVFMCIILILFGLLVHKSKLVGIHNVLTSQL